MDPLQTKVVALQEALSSLSLDFQEEEAGKITEQILLGNFCPLDLLEGMQ